MPSSMVDRATTDLLIGPDWAMNLEICDSLNRDPGLAKDVVRGLKRRIGHKNPKVQLLALTLLETIIKNCGDIVHMHVAEKDLPHEMAKIVKKKPEFNVKEKILVLIDTWQEVFGGPQGRYPQFYAAYHELLHAGVVFPKRPEGSVPLHTPPKKQSLPLYARSSQSSDYQQPETSSGSDFPALSLGEIQNARGIMDVLSEMIDALDPGNKEGLRQEVIRDLVHQCRSYKQRLVDLVNTTSDEDMLCLGLSLNDDLQNVLAKYDALAAGVAVCVENTKSVQALVDIDDPVVTNPDGSTAPDQRSNTSTSNQLSLQHLLIPGPPSNGTATHSARESPNIDLLSGDFNPPAAENPLALVPVSEPLASSATEQNTLVLSDMFSQSTNNNGNNTPTSPFSSFSETSSAHAYPYSPQPTLYSNGSIPNSGVSRFEQLSCQGAPPNNTNPAWNGQGVQGMNLQQQPLNGVYDQGLPPPPWETQPAEITQFVGPQTPRAQNGLPGGVMHLQITLSGQFGATPSGFMQSNQQAGMYQLQMHSDLQPGTFSQPLPGDGSQPGMHPSLMQNGQQLPGSHSQPNQGGHPAGYPGYVYERRLSYPSYSNPNEISQGMYGHSIQDNSSYTNANASPSYRTPTSLYVQQFKKPSKPEDNLFGDLVSMAKTKQNKTDGGGTGTL